jgi:hypothetical protein
LAVYWISNSWQGFGQTFATKGTKSDNESGNFFVTNQTYAKFDQSNKNLLIVEQRK